MASLAQTVHTFADELKSIGINIPKNTTSVIIEAWLSSEPVGVIFSAITLGNHAEYKSGGVLKDSSGEPITALALYNLIKEKVQFPPDTTSFVITANANEIIVITITAALPIGALSSLKNVSVSRL